MSLDPRIRSAGSLAEEAFKELKEIQKGEKPLIKTGQPFIDIHVGGMLPSDLVIYSGGSGSGKTQMLYDTLDKILDENVNPLAKDYVTLEFSLEMLFISKILRDTHSLLKKKKTDIILEEFNEDERVLVAGYYKALQDGRRYVVEESINTMDFYNITKGFCEEFKDKEKIVITLDHTLLVQKYEKNEDAMERLTAHINVLRKEFKNINFIILSQLNRGYLANVAEKSNLMIPTVSMIYGSSHFEFLASFIYVILNPFKMGINEYLKVHEDRYPYLKDYMTTPDAKGKVSFNTLGNLFIHTLKTRESDTPYSNIHIQKMDLSDDQLSKMKQEQSDKITEKEISLPNIPVFNAPPVFDMTKHQETDLTKVFG